ncbi:TetR/AcrR family transcriptional regulator [Acetobacteraceae bacterium KSS8]|uniref:TetR/AcrR family transcriptional regulator n=1 Tax=Endosaccharibacter trunci TaxID=2812733 RepID=A0ABT1W9Y4_9PROT|nr:TetR/AcrR family transcriptional regulator [Acetobacteraceae bacterium KSS8]
MGKSAASSPRGPTRARIIETACVLFNRNGAERTTTRAIAEAAGINEGNLYYHFRSKELLVLAVFERFEHAADALLTDGSSSTPFDYHLRLRGWFELTWAYRFLFRDVAGLEAIAPSLTVRLRRLSVRLQRRVRTMIAGLTEAGLLRIAPEESDRLLDNLWIVASYWIAFLVAHRGVKQIAPRHLEWGFAQVRSLFAPYLGAEMRGLLDSVPVRDE